VDFEFNSAEFARSRRIPNQVIVCNGCIHAVNIRDGGVGLCPFCRIPVPTSDEEVLKRMNKRMETGDPIAIYLIGSRYANGEGGLRKDVTKALELLHRAGELGHAGAYNNIGSAYYYGEGVEMDKKKAKHYWELAAVEGNEIARNNLGCVEEEAGNIDRAIKHYMIAVKSGQDYCLKRIQDLYKKGNATREDYTKALHAYQEYLNEVKSAQRDVAAAAIAEYKYY